MFHSAQFLQWSLTKTSFQNISVLKTSYWKPITFSKCHWAMQSYSSAQFTKGSTGKFLQQRSIYGNCFKPLEEDLFGGILVSRMAKDSSQWNLRQTLMDSYNQYNRFLTNKSSHPPSESYYCVWLWVVTFNFPKLWFILKPNPTSAQIAARRRSDLSSHCPDFIRHQNNLSPEKHQCKQQDLQEITST